MTLHFRRALETLKQNLLALSGLVEERVWQSVRSIEERDLSLAQQVIDGDNEIDTMEVDIEEECLNLLALYHPVAIDLRFIVSVLKINNDLERIGDLAVNIAERSIFLAGREVVEISIDLTGMAVKARRMLRKSLDALVNLTPDLAREVCLEDEEVDKIKREMAVKVKEMIPGMPDRIDCLLHLFLVSRHLERIADLSTNIAEDVIYMVDGVIVRHNVESS